MAVGTLGTGADLDSLARTAAKLGRRAAGARGCGKSPPRLWFLSDPTRTPDLMEIVRRLPAGCVVVYRAFGAEDSAEVAKALRTLTRRRKQTLLIGADARLAACIGADGVHLPERLMHLAPRLRRAHPDWLISAAAHSGAAVRRGGRLKLDVLLVSAVFPSRSPSAIGPLGPVRLARLIRQARTPVIALGGVNNKNAPRLISTGAAGLAAIEALAVRPRT